MLTPRNRIDPGSLAARVASTHSAEKAIAKTSGAMCTRLCIVAIATATPAILTAMCRFDGAAMTSETVASTAIAPGFGVGFFRGGLGGALLAALVFRSFRWQSFVSPRETGRYLSGATLMGIGGVLAGGCTVGAGLAGVPTLSLAALLALGSIVVGALATNAALNAGRRGDSSSGAAPKRQAAQPAE